MEDTPARGKRVILMLVSAEGFAAMPLYLRKSSAFPLSPPTSMRLGRGRGEAAKTLLTVTEKQSFSANRWAEPMDQVGRRTSVLDGLNSGIGQTPGEMFEERCL